MFLIYADDYGNTGERLDERSQPLFMFFGMMVPSTRWVALERDLASITRDVCRDCGVEPSTFRLHAAEFFSERQYPQLSADQKANVALLLAQTAVRHGATFLVSYVLKTEVAQLRSVMATLGHLFQRPEFSVLRDNPNVWPHLERTFEQMQRSDPYVVTLIDFLQGAESALAAQGTQGLIVIDRQQQYGAQHAFKSLSAARQSHATQFLLEQPLQGDSFTNPLLQVADVLGYLYGYTLRTRLQEKAARFSHPETVALIEANATVRSVSEQWDPAQFLSIMMMTERVMPSGPSAPHDGQFLEVLHRAEQLKAAIQEVGPALMALHEAEQDMTEEP